MRQVDLHTDKAAAGPRALLLGQSAVIDQLRTDIDLAARCDSKVLISGETGVGKEVVARLIHQDSVRRLHPFLVVNCAGLPDTLLESELFGHTRGSFTGAYRDKPGLAMMADRGTLFLDELGEMSPRMQGILLRFLETGEVHRVGADRLEPKVDVRVIAATHRNLRERIVAGQFREDLFYRLNVAAITIPPLRDRGEDILLLFDHYLTQYCDAMRIDPPPLMPSTRTRLLNYNWPGNVRELKNVAERLAVGVQAGPITPEMLPAEILRSMAHLTVVQPQRGLVSLFPAADAAWQRMMRGETFWEVVHPLFINREITKNDVREIIRRGLVDSEGSYRRLTELFHLQESDYKRFMAFLRQHDCHISPRRITP